MLRYDIVKNALHKVNQPRVPYCIRFTSEYAGKYRDEIIKRYACKSVLKHRDEFGDCVSDIFTFLDLAIGNSVVGIYPPWWNWDFDQDEFRKQPDIPHYEIRTFGSGSYDKLFRQVETAKEISGAYLTAFIYGSHIEKFQILRGLENSLADIAGDVEGSRTILNFIIGKNLVMLENIVHISGLDGILLGSDWGTQRGLLISPSSWRELIKPGEQLEYNLIKRAGKDIWIHSCGDIAAILPDLAEMGVDVLNPIQPECMDIYALKDTYGNKLSFWGGISTQRTLPNGTPQEVREETRRVVNYLSKNGGYIVSPAQEIQLDVPLENVFALIDTAMEYCH